MLTLNKEYPSTVALYMENHEWKYYNKYSEINWFSFCCCLFVFVCFSYCKYSKNLAKTQT